jgi:hypothetical protein
MRVAASLLALALGACGNLVPPPQALPWVFGFATTATADGPTEAAARDALGLGASDDAAYGALELRAELGTGGEAETVIASYGLGVVVLDAAGHTVARAPAYPPEGSADSIIALATGEIGIGTPVLAVAYQHGGHRENTVTLALYRTAEHGQLQPLFVAPIEEHAGDDTHLGTLVVMPRQLSYRAPDGVTSSWAFDARHGKYSEVGTPRPRVLD